MAKKLYHNITQKIYNETNVIDLIENMNDGDLILYSEYGNGLVYVLPDKELNNIKKYVNDFYYSILDDEEI